MEINKKNILGTFLVIFSIGSIFYGAYFFGQKRAEKKYANSAKENISQLNERKQSGDADLENNKEEEKMSDLPGEMSGDLIAKGQIKWQDPEDLGDLNFTAKELYNGCASEDCHQDGFFSSGIRYFKSGEIINGKYNGYEFIAISSWVHEGPSFGSNIFRVLRKGNNVIFLSNEAYGIDEYLLGMIKKIFSQGTVAKEYNNKIIVEELNYPEELYGLSERQRFIKDPYVQTFFTDAKLKKAFVSQRYGQVWVTDEVKALNENPTAFELNSYYDAYNKVKRYYDIFGRQGFYVKSPDGTAASYKMKMDIFDKNERTGILQAVWNDGKRNTEEYEQNPSGCGGGNYVYNETLLVDVENDLVEVGKTDKGDPLYGYKDTNSPGFQKLYNEIYWVEEGEKKKSSGEFLKTNPKVFWKDYFGRTLAFYKADIISPAECGKPVIYLYPEKDTEVSVEVRPGNGLSYTDPIYGNGWKVLAKNNGELTNLADGKKYPYLFWEGSSSVYYETPQNGFCVADGELDKFFDDKLSQLGLVSKEIYDFKEFWTAKMRESQKPYYFVTFLSKRYIDILAPLKIEPAPDTVIRVMMDYQGLEQPREVPGFEMKTPERKGFTVVEWGGMLK